MINEPQVTVGRIVHLYLHPNNSADKRVGPFAAIVVQVTPSDFTIHPFGNEHSDGWMMPLGIRCPHTQGFKADDWMGASLPPVSWEFPPRV